MMARTAMLTWSLMTKTQQRQRCFGLILNLIYNDDDDDENDDDDDVDDDDVDNDDDDNHDHKVDYSCNLVNFKVRTSRF